MNKGKLIISNRSVINKSADASLHEGFKMKYIEKKKDNDSEEFEEELENYGNKMSCINGVESYANRDFANHNTNCKLDNGIIANANSCDSAAHPVIRYCDRTILA